MNEYKVSEIKYLTLDQLERFFKRIDDKRDKALFLTIYRYGLRASEATLITMGDIKTKDNLIFIRRVKNGISSDRMLFADVKRALNAYLKIRPPLSLDSYEDENSEPLFVGREGSLSTRRIGQLFKKYMRRIDKKMSVHSLRHTCAVEALNNGLGLYDVQALLGHRNISSTLTYLHYTDKRRRQADAKLDRVSYL